MNRTIHRGKIFTFKDQATIKNIQGLIPDSLFVNNDELELLRDGALIVKDGLIEKVCDYHELTEQELDEYKVIDHRPSLIAPGFIDSHMHSTQTSAVGAYGEQLLDWLEGYIFPSEVAFKSEISGKREFDILLKELFKNGTTSICSYLPQSYDGADLLFEMVDQYNMSAVLGNTIMTDGHPDLITDPKTSMDISEKLCNKWHNKGGIKYALTPRFALSTTEETLGLCQEFMQSHQDVYVQTHLNENKNEIKDTLAKYPWAQDYLGVYEKYGLLTDKTILGHCIHMSDSEYSRIKDYGTIMANCPTSNNYLGSGLFNYKKAIDDGIKFSFASDWAAGNTLSMFRVMDDAYKVGMLNGYKLETLTRWFGATLGSAQTLGLDAEIGSLEKGKKADFIVINPYRSDLLSYRLESCYNLLDYLFSISALGDDRIIESTYISGKKVYTQES